MRQVILSNAKVDAAQLRAELSAAGLSAVTVADPDARGQIAATIPDTVDGAVFDRLVQAHFPRSYVAAILAVDFDSPTDLAGIKAACKQLRNRTAAALRARWE